MGEGRGNRGKWECTGVEEQGRGVVGLIGTILLMDASFEAPGLLRGALVSLSGGDLGPLPGCVDLAIVVVSGLLYSLYHLVSFPFPLGQ